MVQHFRYAIALSFAAAILFLASCTKDKAFPVGPVVVDSTCIPNGYIVTYTTDIKPILDTYCTNAGFGSCHQPTSEGGSGFDYTTYAGIKTEADLGTLENRVFVTKDMPSPSSLGPTTLAPCDMAKLQSWINGGAPE